MRPLALPIALFALLPSFAPAAAPPEVAPYRRVLAGEEARRVAQREKRLAALFQAGKFAEALGPAREVLALRERAQGPRHWETRTVRRRVTSLQRLARLSARARERFGAARRSQAEAAELLRKGQAARAESALRRALVVYREALGEENPDTGGQYNALAYCLNAQGDSARAQPLYEKALTISRRVLGEDHPDTATCYNNLASNLNEQARYAPAQALYEHALAIRRWTLGEEHPDTVQSYNNLALCLQAQARYTQAAPLFEKALALERKVLGEDHADTAQGYNNLALCLHAQGKHAAAQPLFEKALTLARKALGDHPSTAFCYGNLAANLDTQGRYARAQRLHERALAIRRKTLGENHPLTAASYNGLGSNLTRQGKYTEAQALHEKALAICKKVLGEDHPDTAESHVNLAGNLNEQGRYARARELYEKALRIRRKVLGEEHPLTAQSYNNLGSCLHAEGRFVESQTLAEKALTICRRALGEEHADTATAYNNVAFHLEGQGKYAAAQPLLEKALAIYKKALGEEHPDTATSYNNLATCLAAQGKDSQAQPLFERALALKRKTLSADHPDVSRSFTNLAGNLQAQGRLAEAQRLHEKALALQLLQGEGHPLTALGYHNLAVCLEKQGKHARAEPLARKAVETWRRALGEGHPDTANALTNLAGNLRSQGRYAEAETLAAKAAPSYQAARLHVARAGLDRTAFASGRSPHTLLAALRARNGKPVTAWQALERGLAPALLDDLAFRRLLSNAEGKQRRELLRRLRLLDRQLQAQPAERAADLRRQRERTQTDLADLEVRLARKYGPAAGKVYTVAAIQKALPAGTALLAFVDVPANPNEADPAGDHWACLLRGKGKPACVRLKGSGSKGAWTAEDEQLPEQVRSLLTGPASSWREPAARLHAQRLAPLSKHLRTIRRLVVLPAPALRGIPLDVLFAAAPADSPAPTVSYALSGTLYAHLRARARPAGRPRLLALADPAFAPTAAPAKLPAPPAHGVLVVAVQRGGNAAGAGLKAGDVLLTFAGSKLAGFDDLVRAVRAQERAPAGRAAPELTWWRQGKSLSGLLRPGPLGLSVDRRPAAEAVRADRQVEALLAQARGGFRPLPGSRREVAAIARLFARADTLLGADASQERLEALARGGLKGYRYLHLATPGLSDADRPMQSFLALADRDLPEAARGPGRLTAEEILRSWELDAELVVLSACRSGLGRYEVGEGYIGFAQALLLAGARSLVVSQWEGDDEATALLLVRFYQNLLGKRKDRKKPLARAAALAEAKRWLRNLSAREAKAARAALPRVKGVSRTKAAEGARPYAHPWFWAGFILVGDSR
jgi:tetratricopeptide (TPR) repeat protein